MAEAECKIPDWVPQSIRDAMKEITALNMAAAKRNALGDLLGFSREFQKNVPIFLDKVLADAEDIARWESMELSPDLQAFIQPQLEEKKNYLQWLEDRLAKLEEPDDTTGSVKEEFTEDQKDGITKKKKPKLTDYEVVDFETGEVYHFAEGTRLQDVKVFAGKGSKNVFRDADVFASRYGGVAEDWQHAKGFALMDTPDGDRPAEVHWVQCPGLGKFEFFIKEWLD